MKFFEARTWTFSFSVFLIFAPLFAHASAPQGGELYVGTARVLNLFSGVQTEERVFLRKTLDPKARRITEIACLVRPQESPELSSIYMLVDGEKVTSISNTPDFTGKLSGSGDLRGTPWAWNHLTFTMEWKLEDGHKVRVVDSNFAVNELLIGRKQIFYDDIPYQLWDIEMKTVSAERFAELVSAIQCPPF